MLVYSSQIILTGSSELSYQKGSCYAFCNLCNPDICIAYTLSALHTALNTKEPCILEMVPKKSGDVVNIIISSNCKTRHIVSLQARPFTLGIKRMQGICSIKC